MGTDLAYFVHDDASQIISELEPCVGNCNAGANVSWRTDYVYFGATRVALFRANEPPFSLLQTFTESFENGTPALASYVSPQSCVPFEDVARDAHAVVNDGSDGTHALALSANSWKTLPIAPQKLTATRRPSTRMRHSLREIKLLRPPSMSTRHSAPVG